MRRRPHSGCVGRNGGLGATAGLSDQGLPCHGGDSWVGRVHVRLPPSRWGGACVPGSLVEDYVMIV